MTTMEIRADVTGTVFKLAVAVGDLVHAGDEIAVLESMKMEIPVEAVAGGRVARVMVAEGDAVRDGQPLLHIATGSE